MRQEAIEVDTRKYLNDEERLCLTVEPFLQGVALYQSPSEHLDFL